jgi:hypothetical protein
VFESSSVIFFCLIKTFNVLLKTHMFKEKDVIDTFFNILSITQKNILCIITMNLANIYNKLKKIMKSDFNFKQ